MKRWTPLIVTLVLVVSACARNDPSASSSPPGSGSDRGGTTGPGGLTAALAKIENQPKYHPSDWGYSVLDQKTGRVVASQNADHLFDPGSTMKTYAVSTALRLYGSDYQFHTPVYRAGNVSAGSLNGNLVLVGSGDLTFGLREQPDGTLFYENAPELNQSYADVGVPGAIEPPGNPLAGLDQLASMVRSAGITHVNGDVVIDDRLFTPFNGFPDGLISPIWVNENLIDALVTPGTAAGEPTSINWRPMTASYTVDNQTTTVAANGTTSLAIEEPSPGHLVVTGAIAAKSTPRLVVIEIKDPSAFARTAFIEALQRAGVSVTATPTGPNPAALLPAKDSYQPADKLAEHVSTTLAQYINLIMKVSYNRGADLMTCLSAVKTGSTDCEHGLVAEVETFTGLGVSETSVFPMDGAGSDDQGRSSPAALASFYRAAAQTPYAQTLFDSLPVLGKSGTIANVLTDSPAAGHVQVKTGNRVVGTPAEQSIVLGNSLAGYIQAKSGRQLTFMVAVGNVPISSITEFLQITDDQARMVALIQQSF
jgi:D-alanyl-D-alanine carboxypeptidase/D-alanyl-D-alanine-endopeptidase (penicillin-binding protein 4)